MNLAQIILSRRSGGALGSEGIPSPETASVGQTIVVSEVDENSKPTAWIPANLPTGGGSEWKHLRTVTIPEDITTDTSGVNFAYASADTPENGVLFGFDTDKDGVPFEIGEMLIYTNAATPHTTGNFFLAGNTQKPSYGNGGNIIANIATDIEIGTSNNKKNRVFSYTIIQNDTGRQFSYGASFGGGGSNPVRSQVYDVLFTVDEKHKITKLHACMINLPQYGFSVGSTFEFYGR